ncbi:MAG TPA: methyltransferase domain-containing protein [Gaiellaceae bacterium]|nr:methyltransferase domain-containing protein [Gaiellaceae bacterium]
MPDAVQEQPETAETVRRFADLSTADRVLVVGAAGIASSLEPHVREVVETEADRLIDLPFPRGSFDVVATIGTLHHVRRPELAVAELARVTRLGGRLLVADRLGSIDPLTAIELDRLERESDPAHTRFLPDADMRGLFDANGLVLLRSQVDARTGTGWYLLRR